MRVVQSYALMFAVFVAAALGGISCGHHGGGTLAAITVTPGHAQVAAGGRVQFTATAIFTDGTAILWTSAVTWRTSDNSAVTIGNDLSTFGLATSLGVTTIKAVTIIATDVANNISGYATLIVTPTPLVSLSLTPVDAIISAGTPTQFKATGTYADGTASDVTDFVNWQSSNNHVATVSTEIGSKGRAEGVGIGQAMITAIDPSTNAEGRTSLRVE